MVDLPVTLLLEHLNLPMRDNKGYFYSHLFYEKYNSCRRWSFSLTLVGIKWKTAFNTPLGHSEYPVMAFRFSLLALPFTSSYSINPPSCSITSLFSFGVGNWPASLQRNLWDTKCHRLLFQGSPFSVSAQQTADTFVHSMLSLSQIMNLSLALL